MEVSEKICFPKDPFLKPNIARKAVESMGVEFRIFSKLGVEFGDGDAIKQKPVKRRLFVG